MSNEYLECTKRVCKWIGRDVDLVKGKAYMSGGVVQSDMLCPECGHYEHYVLKIFNSLVKAQEDAIEERLKGSMYNTKEKLLSYFDVCCFRSMDVVQDQYKNLTAALNRLSKRGVLVKVHSGSGSLAQYVFPKDVLAELIDKVMERSRRTVYEATQPR